MGASNMNPCLNEFIKQNYADYKSDFFSAFVVRASQMTKLEGRCGFFTPYVWMFIQSYEKLRQYLYSQATLETLIQFEYSAFEEATVPVCTFTFAKRHVNKKGNYLRLVDFRGGMEVQRQKTLEAIANHNCGFYYEQSTDNFAKIPGSPVAYWVSENFIKAYDNKRISDYGVARSGLQTGNNDLFLKYWQEVNINTIAFGMCNKRQYLQTGRKWTPQIKGGEYRKWYGNFDYVVNWEDDGREIRNCSSCRLNAMGNDELFFKEGITWSHTTSSVYGARYLPSGFLFNVEAPTLFVEKLNEEYLLGLLNSCVSQYYLSAINATMHYLVGNILALPVEYAPSDKINEMVDDNISACQKDWDSFEASWDFKKHPLIKAITKYPSMMERGNIYLAECYDIWAAECEERFARLKANEEELNRIFIDIYGLQDELTPEVEDKDVTVRKADLQRDVKSLLSYAVGCLFGRYAPETDGLMYAGGAWDESRYHLIHPVKDNVLPLCDEEYFGENDLVNRVVEFIKEIFGASSLEDNLAFIAKALGNKGNTSREIIRNYFLKDFYADHCKIYQKRPIYWMFDSGKKNGFKALVYLHRWDADTTGRVYNNYLSPLLRTYAQQIMQENNVISSSSDARTVSTAQKRLDKLKLQQEECEKYEKNIAHLAALRIALDLDDGVKANYVKAQTAADGKNLNVLVPIK